MDSALGRWPDQPSSCITVSEGKRGELDAAQRMISRWWSKNFAMRVLEFE